MAAPLFGDASGAPQPNALLDTATTCFVVGSKASCAPKAGAVSRGVVAARVHACPVNSHVCSIVGLTGGQV
jgi:hypothetical protein